MRYLQTMVQLVCVLGVATIASADPVVDCSRRSLANVVDNNHARDIVIQFTGVCGPVVINTDGITLQGVGNAVIDGGGLADAVTIAGASRVSLESLEVRNGINGLVKRVSDVVLATAILLLVSPLMLAIAAGVKLTSRGPVLFRQRRYGVDGREIVVYKFRSMTVCEDGDAVRQASRNDSRVTPFGAFLRRTSLDELPQFINVLQGRMSVVGPRPHAVAHNEMYRRLIKRYMIRHKVKPGITGLAQINGLRGETETVDKMRARIEYDLAYLRDWSLRLDLQIIVTTVFVVLKHDNAY